MVGNATCLMVFLPARICGRTCFYHQCARARERTQFQICRELTPLLREALSWLPAAWSHEHQMLGLAL
jgi:hypothetical protein